MTQLQSPARHRIQSIDILRGAIMVIMALDHVRDFFHKTIIEGGSDVATGPTDLDSTTPLLFFTRWVTHFCAPIFVFLAGTSAFLMSFKKTKAELSRFLLTRGIFLVLVEVLIITLGWTFNPLYNVIILQVIWAIGISMILLGLLIYFPFRILLAIGVLIVFGHNILNHISTVKPGESLIADLLYFSDFSVYNLDKSHFILIVYSFLPWTGVMILGYCFGELYRPGRDAIWRRKTLLTMGFGCLLFFIVMRFINLYGDPVPWSEHSRGPVFSFLSFINVNKYPPSLDFLAITLGAGMIALALLEQVRSAVTEFFRIFGRVPMFFYILHFYLIHLVVVAVFFIQGYSTDRIVTDSSPFLFRPPEFGFGLLGVYVVWIGVVLFLYPLCKWYDKYKSANVHRKKWLSYL